MGTIYSGPYAELICAGDHEGYAARILPDGTETSTWTWDTREFTGYRAHCDCGWRGELTYPATDQGARLADDEWFHDHLQPMIRAEADKHTIPARDLLEFLGELRQASTTADRGGRDDFARGLYHAAQWLGELLDSRAQQVRRS